MTNSDPAPAAVRLPVDPGKLFAMTWPIYALALLSLAIQPRRWIEDPATSAAVLLIPLALPLLGALARNRWRLELTPEALAHITLRGPERYDWRRMGEPEIRLIHILHLPIVRTLWFPYPLDAPRTAREAITARIGRRILLVFGDRPSAALLEEVRAWRRLALEAPQPYPPADRP